MLILVVYDDGTHDLVEAYQLDYLIGIGRISEFCRSSGWVKIGLDPVRGPEREYIGQERRTRMRMRNIMRSPRPGEYERSLSTNR